MRMGVSSLCTIPTIVPCLPHSYSRKHASAPLPNHKQRATRNRIKCPRKATYGSTHARSTAPPVRLAGARACVPDRAARGQVSRHKLCENAYCELAAQYVVFPHEQRIAGQANAKDARWAPVNCSKANEAHRARDSIVPVT